MGLVEADRSKSDGGISPQRRPTYVFGFRYDSPPMRMDVSELVLSPPQGNPLDSDTTRVTRTIRGTTGLSHMKPWR